MDDKKRRLEADGGAAAAKKAKKPLPPNYVCKACGMKDDHAIHDCPLKVKKIHKVLETVAAANPAQQAAIEAAAVKAAALAEVAKADPSAVPASAVLDVGARLTVFVSGLPLTVTREDVVRYFTGGRRNQPAAAAAAVEEAEAEADKKSKKEKKEKKEKKDKKDKKRAKEGEEEAAATLTASERQQEEEAKEEVDEFVCSCEDGLEAKAVKLVMFEDNPKKCKGIAFVRLSSVADYQRCLAATDQAVIQGRVIKIVKASSRSSSSSSSSGSRSHGSASTGGGSAPRHRQKGCYRCGQMHDSATCTNPRICYRCKSTEHISSACPHKKYFTPGEDNYSWKKQAKMQQQQQQQQS